jgi:hypothetical protein
MNLNIDFVLLIAVLVLIQLFVLSTDFNKDENSNNGRNRIVDALSEEAVDNSLTDNKELSLVVHRSNGEEKIYKKSDVA